MVELKNDELVFSFPDVHPEARVTINFQRTLRIPDDDNDYPLPPGLGKFTLAHVDDHADRVPDAWLEHGGVMLPMYQSEALWLRFNAGYVRDRGSYPFAIKIATGKINALTGEAWRNGLSADERDHVVVPQQPWLDGYCVEKGIIRQFVAMPLGAGYTAEEQITGAATHGGLQVAVYPMRRDAFERHFPKREMVQYRSEIACQPMPAGAVCMTMGLAPGGRMRQEIYDDPYALAEWDTTQVSRCFVHLCNSMVWQSITGAAPPRPPLTAAEYTRQGMPWFDYYADHPVRDGADKLRHLKSVREMAEAKKTVALPENESTTPKNVIKLRPPNRNEVREGAF